MRKRATKPQLKTILAIIEKKKQAIELLNEVEELTSDLSAKYGEARFDYEVQPFTNDKGKECKYLKFEVVDNIEKLNRGEDIYQNTIFKRTTFTSMYLIKMPESLK